MEDEIAFLRQKLREEQARREEEQARREQAEDRALDEQRRREEEQHRREEEQRRREEEQRRREEAEELTKTSQPQTLQKYLESCHSLSLAIQVVTDRTLTTQGETTNPTGRIFPRQIIPWDDFAIRQEEIWDQLLNFDSFSSEAVFPSPHQLEYVMSLIRPISSELGLRNFQRDTVENAVQKLVEKAYSNERLRQKIGLQGIVTFESHTNLGQTDEALPEAMEQMSIEQDDNDPAATASKLSNHKPRRRARGKGNRADQFCIYRTSDGRNVPALAIEYKAPHKLRRDEVVTGLESEIRPERDVINKDGEGFAFASRSLVAAVVTQLFSYMIGKGIRYGYVCTGEAFVFLHIPDDPTIVYYSVRVPNLDVLDGENSPYGTAVAQVFAFILQALRAEPPPLSWHDATTALDTWAVEYDDVLRNIPETVRKGKEARPSPYKPQRWRGFKRSPIRTRSRCKQSDGTARLPDDSSDDGEGTPPSPTPSRVPHTQDKAIVTSTVAGSARKEAQQSKRGRQHSQGKQQNIKDCPFCTTQCLLGLASGGRIDGRCPNSQDHGQQHLNQSDFLRLVRTQLAEDRGPDADVVPLHLSGSTGSLFKVRLSRYGYTLVAKGVETLDLARLCHENEVYDRLHPIQGKYVPVCLGRADLALPLYYDSGVYKHVLFLSWAGVPLFDTANQAAKADINVVAQAYKKMHKLGVLHRDAELRNVLRDTVGGSIMVVDFERAELSCRPPLGLLNSNVQSKKRKRAALEKPGSSVYQGKDGFAIELESIVGHVSRYITAVQRRTAVSVDSKVKMYDSSV
uniref:Serine threonine protein kinase n=1 Tax=Colletotrichum fructicola (strain Nara gc5) TaxID=1213859 RepID=L2G987_COLFN